LVWTCQLRHRLSARRKLASLSRRALRHSSQYSKHNDGKLGGGFTHVRCFPCFRKCVEVFVYSLYPVEKISTLTSMNNRPYSGIVNVGAIRPMSPGHSEYNLWKTAPCCKYRSNRRRLDFWCLLSRAPDNGDIFITSSLYCLVYVLCWHPSRIP